MSSRCRAARYRCGLHHRVTGASLAKQAHLPSLQIQTASFAFAHAHDCRHQAVVVKGNPNPCGGERDLCGGGRRSGPGGLVPFLRDGPAAFREKTATAAAVPASPCRCHRRRHIDTGSWVRAGGATTCRCRTYHRRHLPVSTSPSSGSSSCRSPLLAIAPHCPPPPSPSVQSATVSIKNILLKYLLRYSDD